MRILVTSLLLLAITASISVYAQKLKLNEYAVAQISIERCLESENISIPINRSYLVSGRGVSGGGSSRECGNYSYAMYAVRQGRKRVSVHLSVSVNAVSVEKDIVLTRGNKNEFQLRQGIKVVASY